MSSSCYTGHCDAVHGLYNTQRTPVSSTQTRPTVPPALAAMRQRTANWQHAAARTHFEAAVKEFGAADAVENRQGGSATWRDRAMYANVVVRDTNDGRSVSATLDRVRLPAEGVAEIAAMNNALAGSGASLVYDAGRGELAATGRSMAHVACILKVAVDVALDDDLTVDEARSCLGRMVLDAENDDQVYCEVCSALEEDVKADRAAQDVNSRLTAADRDALRAGRDAAERASANGANAEQVVHTAVLAATERNAANKKSGAATVVAGGSGEAAVMRTAVDRANTDVARIATAAAESSGANGTRALEAAYRAAVNQARQGATPAEVVSAALDAAGIKASDVGAVAATAVRDAQQALVDAGTDAVLRAATSLAGN